MTTFHGPPEDLGQLHNLFLEACKTAGLTVLEDGCSYSNGPEWNAEIRLPDGFVAFTTIRESQDDNYLIERYEGEENEPDDPDGRPRTMTLTNEGAEALRRELEEEEHFAERAYLDDDDSGVGFAPGIQ